jgi:hypothetical protein
MTDAESILSDVVDPRAGTNFEKWLESEGPETEALFWDVMKLGRERRLPFAHAMRAFMSRYPEAGPFDNQSAKRVVDAHFKDDG